MNLGENSQQFRNYLRDRIRTPPRTNQKTDELARHYMYTSAQQAASDEVAWGKMLVIPFSPSKMIFLRFEITTENTRSINNL